MPISLEAWFSGRKAAHLREYFGLVPARFEEVVPGMH